MDAQTLIVQTPFSQKTPFYIGPLTQKVCNVSMTHFFLTLKALSRIVAEDILIL